MSRRQSLPLDECDGISEGRPRPTSMPGRRPSWYVSVRSPDETRKVMCWMERALFPRTILVAAISVVLCGDAM